MTTDRATASTVAGSWVPFSTAARYLGVSERTLRRHIAKGVQRAQRVGGRIEVFVEHAEDRRHWSHMDATRGRLEAAAAVSLTHALAALRETLAAERARADRAEVWLHDAEEQRVQLAQEVARLRIEAEALRASLEAHALTPEREIEATERDHRASGRPA